MGGLSGDSGRLSNHPGRHCRPPGEEFPDLIGDSALSFTFCHWRRLCQGKRQNVKPNLLQHQANRKNDKPRETPELGGAVLQSMVAAASAGTASRSGRKALTGHTAARG